MKQYSFLIEDYTFLEENKKKSTIASILAALGLLSTPAVKMPEAFAKETGAKNLAQAIVYQLKKPPKHKIDYTQLQKGFDLGRRIALSADPSFQKAADASKLGQGIIDTVKGKPSASFTNNVRKVIQGE